VQHQDVHQDVVNEEVGDIDAGRESHHHEEAGERDQVRRIETADASLPKGSKVDLRSLARGSSLCPLQVDAEARYDEKKKNADVAKRTEKLDQFDGVSKEIVRNRSAGLMNCVIENNTESGDSSQGVDTNEAIRWRRDAPVLAAQGDGILVHGLVRRS